MILETTRLELVPLGPEFAAELWAIYADPDVARYVGGDSLTPESTLAQTERCAREWAERGHGQSAVIWKKTGQLIGRIGLSAWPEWREIELGYALSRSAQGHGLATEGAQAWIDWARNNLTDDYLTAVIHPDNAPSTRLTHRLGFTLGRKDTVKGTAVNVYYLPLNAVPTPASTPNPTSGCAMPEHAVIINLSLGEEHFGSVKARETVRALEHDLAAILDAGTLGYFDGDEFGGGEAVTYLYGPNADNLYAAIEPRLQAVPLRPAHVTIRHGAPGTPERICHLR
ncbi:GNAT family N-acetyltransferase [Kribbella sp. NPDC051620]|uniref:GNAT family N-acetyltransferase n=1 Tax=Kribbella sp. NPDC051620 TaxID=3364120 RepID=UPI0037B41B46